MVLCHHGDQLVGMRGAAGTRWETRSGEAIVLPCAHDLLIHPDHRSKGIFVPLMKHLEKEAAKAGHHTLINLSGGEVTQNLQLGTGWREVQILKELSTYSSSTPDRTRSNIQMKVLKRYVHGIARRLSVLPPIIASQNYYLSMVMKQISRSNPRIQITDQVNYPDISALSGVHCNNIIGPARDEESFSWRVKNPNWRFIIAYWIDSKVRGYLVLTWKKTRPRSVFVFDYAMSDLIIFNEMVGAIGATLPVPLRILENSLTSNQKAILKDLGFSTAVEGFPEGVNKRFMLKHLKGEDERMRSILQNLKYASVHTAEKM